MRRTFRAPAARKRPEPAPEVTLTQVSLLYRLLRGADMPATLPYGQAAHDLWKDFDHDLIRRWVQEHGRSGVRIPTREVALQLAAELPHVEIPPWLLDPGRTGDLMDELHLHTPAADFLAACQAIGFDPDAPG